MPDSASTWWVRLRETAPVDLHGLWFGFVELAPGGSHMYVAGTATFDPDDETAEWAVGPYAWWPEHRYLPMPELQQLEDGAAVAHAAEVVRSLSPWRDTAVDGVAVGFDDGDFEIVFRS